MKFNNKFIRAVILAGLVSLTASSCSDYLDREPLGRYNEDAIPLESDLETMYNDLRHDDMHGMPFAVLTSVRSDDALKGSTPTDNPPAADVDDIAAIKADNWMVSAKWTKTYQVIYDANVIIDKVEKSTDPNKSIYKANAHFIRAYCYFQLVRDWGGVPIVTTSNYDDPSLANPGRATVAQVYQLIEDDLSKAASGLVKDGLDRKGLPGPNAAQALRAKVAAYQSKWSEVIAAVNAIDMGNPDISKLNPDYGMNAGGLYTDGGELCEESFFEIQCMKTPAYPANYGSTYGESQGIRGGVGQGWGFNVPSQNLIEAFEPGDKRYPVTINNTQVTSRYGEDLTDCDYSAPLVYNGKIYTCPVSESDAIHGGKGASWVNIRSLRYADALLLRAEAYAAQGGKDAEALASLNVVRQRAGLAPKVGLTGTALMDAVRQERRIEMALESDRIYDIIRWGIAATIFNASNDGGSGSPGLEGQLYNNATWVPGKSELLPIPQGQIDISNGKLTQNPGY